MFATARIRYRYGPSRAQGNITIRVEGRSESSVIAELRRRHNTDQIEIISLDWM